LRRSAPTARTVFAASMALLPLMRRGIAVEVVVRNTSAPDGARDGESACCPLRFRLELGLLIGGRQLRWRLHACDVSVT
jgi:hypothetical protein